VFVSEPVIDPEDSEDPEYADAGRGGEADQDV
jgi:hypothetical protein